MTTCRAVFDIPNAARDDCLLVIATPGWITGQSYMIAAALLCRTPSVQLEGSPVTPPDRFAAVIARHRVSILKAGSTFLRMVMTGGSESRLALHDLSSLRLGTFCAEPVNQAVHPHHLVRWLTLVVEHDPVTERATARERDGDCGGGCGGLLQGRCIR